VPFESMNSEPARSVPTLPREHFRLRVSNPVFHSIRGGVSVFYTHARVFNLPGSQIRGLGIPHISTVDDWTDVVTS
jgi:hypothetical protein